MFLSTHCLVQTTFCICSFAGVVKGPVSGISSVNFDPWAPNFICQMGIIIVRASGGAKDGLRVLRAQPGARHVQSRRRVPALTTSKMKMIRSCSATFHTLKVCKIFSVFWKVKIPCWLTEGGWFKMEIAFDKYIYCLKLMKCWKWFFKV